MRITAEAKAETRQRIVEAAAELFASQGWNNATTRGIASEAGIAAGTLFNYFDSKEAIVADILSEALAAARQTVRRRRTEYASLGEELFDLIWTELKSLRKFRTFLPSAAETVFNPIRHAASGSPGESIRIHHLETVEQIIASHEGQSSLSPIALQLYWTLYIGVFAYWASDDSSGQEDTLSLLDQSLKLFVASLNQPRGGNRGYKPERPRGSSAAGQRQRMKRGGSFRKTTS